MPAAPDPGRAGPGTSERAELARARQELIDCLAWLVVRQHHRRLRKAAPDLPEAGPSAPAHGSPATS